MVTLRGDAAAPPEAPGALDGDEDDEAAGEDAEAEEESAAFPSTSSARRAFGAGLPRVAANRAKKEAAIRSPFRAVE